jgi:hypothetical protein
MQTYIQKFLKKTLAFFLLLLQVLDSQAQNQNLQRADSVFSLRRFDEAKLLYEAELQKQTFTNPVVYLKLAQIAENKEDFLLELYYLNQYFLRKPNEKFFNKIYAIANDRGYLGYEKNDLNYLMFFYRQYSNYIILFLLGLGIFIFSTLLWKKYKKHYSPTRHKVVLFFYLIILGFLVNFPNNYNWAIIKKEDTYIRSFPSNGSSVLGTIQVGNRVNVLNSNDIWLHILWDGQLCYIKESDVYLIK